MAAAADRSRRSILALHGFNDYSNAFDMPAKAWAAHGIATYAYDQRGFGGAPGRGSWAGEGRLAVDAITAIRVLRRTYPGRPIYLLGESMGGAIAILAATGTMSGVVAGPEGMPRAEADGVILSAPAVWGRATMDLLPKAALFFAVRLFPDTVLSGRGLGIRISDNDAMLRQMARDPMVIKGTRVDAVYGLVDLMDSALEAAPRLDVPLLLMYGAHDEVVPRRPVAEFVAQLPTEPRYPPPPSLLPGGLSSAAARSRRRGGSERRRELDRRPARAAALEGRRRRRRRLRGRPRRNAPPPRTIYPVPAPRQHRRSPKRQQTGAGDPSETCRAGKRGANRGADALAPSPARG